MASVKLTSGLREEILNKIIDVEYKAKRKDLIEKTRVLVESFIMDLNFKVQESLDKVKSYVYVSGKIIVAPNQSSYAYSVENIVCVLDKCYPIPSTCFIFGNSDILDVSKIKKAKWREIFTKLLKESVSLVNFRDKIKTETKRVLWSCNTVKQLLHVFPEVTKYVPLSGLYQHPLVADASNLKKLLTKKQD